MISLEPDERYSRQVLFAGIGHEGQRKLATSRGAIVGCGATGSAIAALLARAGVGDLRIVDRDYVEASNLQRQSLFDEADAAQSLPKAVAAGRKLSSFNSQVTIDPHVADLTPGNIDPLLHDASIILDGTDNFETRYLINDYAVKHGLPWIYTGAVGSYGVTLNILPGKTACLNCIFPAPPKGAVETCETAGILNSVVNVAASYSANEAIKILVGAEDRVRRSLLSFDLWRNEWIEVSANKPTAGCRACGEHDFVHLAGKERAHVTLCGRNSVQIHERHRPLDLQKMSLLLQPHGEVRRTDFILKFWPKPYEITLFPDGRAIIKGTTDSGVARSLYARYVGS
ncbi:MAG: molybdopterin-synthase adenylyltransferase MoeB [Terriglobales bacterium]